MSNSVLINSLTRGILGRTPQSNSYTVIITSDILGNAVVPDVPFLTYDGKPVSIDSDYFGNKRNVKKPVSGPLENIEDGKVSLKVW